MDQGLSSQGVIQWYQNSGIVVARLLGHHPLGERGEREERGKEREKEREKERGVNRGRR